MSKEFCETGGIYFPEKIVDSFIDLYAGLKLNDPSENDLCNFAAAVEIICAYKRNNAAYRKTLICQTFIDLVCRANSIGADFKFKLLLPNVHDTHLGSNEAPTGW